MMILMEKETHIIKKVIYYLPLLGLGLNLGPGVEQFFRIIIMK
jgi:hypothetical protein